MKYEVDDVVVVDDGQDGPDDEHAVRHPPVGRPVFARIGHVSSQRHAGVLLEHTRGACTHRGLPRALPQEGRVQKRGALRAVGAVDQRFGVCAWT